MCTVRKLSLLLILLLPCSLVVAQNSNKPISKKSILGIIEKSGKTFDPEETLNSIWYDEPTEPTTLHCDSLTTAISIKENYKNSKDILMNEYVFTEKGITFRSISITGQLHEESYKYKDTDFQTICEKVNSFSVITTISYTDITDIEYYAKNAFLLTVSTKDETVFRGQLKNGKSNISGEYVELIEYLNSLIPDADEDTQDNTNNPADLFDSNDSIDDLVL